jgi:hypothetical protein
MKDEIRNLMSEWEKCDETDDRLYREYPILPYTSFEKEIWKLEIKKWKVSELEVYSYSMKSIGI